MPTYREHVENKIAKLHGIGRKLAGDLSPLPSARRVTKNVALAHFQITRARNYYLNGRQPVSPVRGRVTRRSGKLIFTLAGTPIYEGIVLSLAY